ILCSVIFRFFSVVTAVFRFCRFFSLCFLSTVLRLFGLFFLAPIVFGRLGFLYSLFGHIIFFSFSTSDLSFFFLFIIAFSLSAIILFIFVFFPFIVPSSGYFCTF